MAMASGMTIEPIGNYRATWGEGPIWWNGCLLYVDIEQHKVIRFDPSNGNETEYPVGERVGTVVPREAGGFVIAGDNGLYFMNEDGELQAITDPEPDKPDNRFNDGKCSPDGHFFAGTISLVKKEGDARLYKLDKNGEFSEAFGPVTNSNGIAWSLDGTKMYYIDTPRREVLSFDYADGKISNMGSAVDTSAVDASPDGMTIDADGNLWIAFCHGACVVCYSPVTGEEIRRVEVPCLETTACAFGGENLDELYITTGVHKTEVEEHAGKIFRVTGLGVRGVKAYAYQG